MVVPIIFNYRNCEQVHGNLTYLGPRRFGGTIAFKVMSGSDGVTEYKPEMGDPDSMEFKKVAEAVENQVRKKQSA